MTTSDDTNANGTPQADRRRIRPSRRQPRPPQLHAADSRWTRSARRPRPKSNRIAAVREICAGRHPEIEAQAIREGWDETATRTGGAAGQAPDGAGGARAGQRRSTAACWRRPAC